jgi:hypothetical protein
LASFVVNAAFGDAVFAGCWRVLVRGGIFSVRVGASAGMSRGTVTGAVGLHSVGNHSRLPGCVANVRPSGEVHHVAHRVLLVATAPKSLE